MKARIAVLVSGGGTNLQALIDAQASGIIQNGEIVLVVSNRADAFALQRAEKAGIRHEVLTVKDCGGKEAFEEALCDLLTECGVDIIVLAGFMQILSGDFTAKYAGRIINVHPSLIPKFCGEGFYGLKVHEAVLAAGEKVTGATVHFVNEIPDGGEIIFQKEVAVQPGDTPETLQLRVMQEAEWKILPAACEKLSKEVVMDVYRIKTIEQSLAGKTYVGRGIVVGKTPSGKAAVAYFIMGRSENSRNRVFVQKDDGLYTEPFDVSKVEDPSLIIYRACAAVDAAFVVTNGDQTDTIVDFLTAGKTFEEALETREFEPDGPNWTPRISAMLTFAEGDFTYKMSILKSADPAGSACNRYTFGYEPLAGLGHFIHTYEDNGSPLPTFQGEPERLAIPDDLEEFTARLWNALDDENKIAIYTTFIDLESGGMDSRLVNLNR